MKARELLERHRDLWSGATRHPFLEGVRRGTLPRKAFERWLVQDYLFVLEGLKFQANLLARAPRRDQRLLIGGLSDLEEELGWFEEQAGRRGLDLHARPHPINAAYCGFLARLKSEAYAAGITALWALERAYLEAWRGAAPGAPEYREFVEHWSMPEFEEYVLRLEEAVDAALGEAPEEERARAGRVFPEVARLERDFWEMALEGGEE
ncbi:aminopyrimidine aminohydrolase [Rubrobacter xylanophilus]|uniref:Aminopyrimidine aminohydrolase n=1 Tax=Rubrobacter xylanophilus TaxID=49319 RepID=A0A510HHR0_9ACTN|nr:TenA family transcriptional regulator [Rubrobacter xylanophilus]BBL79511.1 aminopyrimidine aminohydrolase [Rubrobacter xylanophilus]